MLFLYGCKRSEHTKILYYIIVIYNGYSIHQKEKTSNTDGSKAQCKNYNIYAIAILFVLALYIALVCCAISYITYHIVIF